MASALADEPMPGTAPAADWWVVVEHQAGWGAAPLARTEHGVRVVMARPLRGFERAPQVWIARAASPGGERPWLRRGPVDAPEEVADWDLAEIAAGGFDSWGKPVDEPVLLLCANGRRDRCCGHIGGRLASDLAEHPDAASILTSTHLGGHRFAPTALLLPWGVLHGRLDHDSLLQVLHDARAGRTPEWSLRGHSTLAAPAQVAEVHARAATGYQGLAPLAVDVTISGEHASAVVHVPGAGQVRVALRRDVPDVLPSCGKQPEPTARWVVLS